MTGPEHYTRAEYWADAAEQAKRNNASDVVELTELGVLHATLALAAATAMAAYQGADEDRGTMPSVDSHAWDQVAGVNPL